jgi:hypothetical protein
MTEAFTYKKARREMRRAIKAIDKNISRRLRRFDDARYVVAVSYTSEVGRDNLIIPTWHFCGDETLQAKVKEWTPALENAMLVCEHGSDVKKKREQWLVCPRNSEERAKKVRHMLRLLWVEHVKGTAYEGKKQMYDLVNKQGCKGFDWWEKVTHGAPFLNTTLDTAAMSKLLFEHCAPMVYAMF